MIQIKRRYDFDDWELIAEYEDGEFSGDEDFTNAFGYLEGEEEQVILEMFDGPDTVAMQSEEEEKAKTPISDELAERASEALSEKLGSGAGGAGSATYGGAHDNTDPYPDDVEEDEEYQKAWEAMEERRQQSLKKSEGFERVDDGLMKFYTHVVWWGLEEQHSDDQDLDLSKAPNMWESSDKVPDFVQEFIERAVRDDAFWQGRLKELPAGAEQFVRDLFEEKMTQPQGWSLGSIIDELEEMFPGTDEDYLLMLTRNETAALANEAREEAYTEYEDSDEFEFYWSGPEDFRTTDVCSEMKERTHPRFNGDPLPLPELRDALEEVARKYPEGKTERLDEWVPHFQCRHTFVRKVYL